MRIRRSTVAAVALATAVALVAGGCSSGPPEPTPPATPTPTASASPPPAPPRASRPPRPRVGACYPLTDEQALTPTTDLQPVPCRRRHTAMTFHVGSLDTLVDGHLLAVDSRSAQAQVAAACPRRLAGFLGGTEEQRRLSTLRAVWFSPTLEQSDEGQGWFRCDVVAVGSNGALAPLTGPLRGVLDRPADRERYAVCGTAEPGTPDFRRVLCSQPHTWRAIASYDVTGAGPRGQRYPGSDAVRAVAETRCQEAGRSVAADALNYQWGYDWPTRQQWATGLRYGLCWAPA